MELVEGAKARRGGDLTLEPVERGAERLLAREDVDPADVRDILEQLGQPDLAEETGDPGQQDVAARVALLDREGLVHGRPPQVSRGIR